MHSESKTRFVPTLIISWCVNLYWLFEKTIIAWTIWVNPWTCDQFDSVLKILMIQTSQKEQFIFVLEPLLKAAFPLHIPESEKLHFLSFYLHFFSASLQKNWSKDVKWEADSLGDIWDSLLLCQVLHAFVWGQESPDFLDADRWAEAGTEHTIPTLFCCKQQKSH